MPNRPTLVAVFVVLAAAAVAAPVHAQRRMGSQIGPLTFRLTASPQLCLSGGEWRPGSSVRLNPCGAADSPDAAVIFDNEYSYLKPAANPALCIMVERGAAGQALILNPCTTGSDANRSWSFTRRKGLWLRDNSDMCAAPESQAGGRVLLTTCRTAPGVWTCQVIPNPPPLDGGYPAARSQEWCDR